MSSEIPHREIRARPWMLAIASLIVVALVAACGGGQEDGGESEVAVPPDCLASWNGEDASLSFGRHAYDEHAAREAQLAVLETSRGAINIKGDETCAMIFAVPETDEEYGDVGLAVTKFGWASMQELSRLDYSRLEELQREATRAPNVAVFPDGTVEEL
jgi:hypothetical protein